MCMGTRQRRMRSDCVSVHKETTSRNKNTVSSNQNVFKIATQQGEQIKRQMYYFLKHYLGQMIFEQSVAVT